MRVSQKKNLNQKRTKTHDAIAFILAFCEKKKSFLLFLIFAHFFPSKSRTSADLQGRYSPVTPGLLPGLNEERKADEVDGGSDC